MRSRGRVFYVALLMFSTAAAARDLHQLEEQLQSEYVNKYWFINGFYGGDALEYDASGKLVTGHAPESWTVSGVEINRLKLHKGTIEIGAKRVVYVYDRSREKFTRTYRESLPRRPKRPATVQIRVQLPDTTDDGLVRKTLSQVLLADTANLSAVVPEHWRYFLIYREQGQRPDSAVTDGTLAGGKRVYRVGEVKPPRPVSTPDPQYSDAARAGRFQGVVILGAIVDKSGHTGDIQVIQPFGVGLDDKAVEAVRQWTFVPAERQGDPVAVWLRIEVSFRLY